MITINYIILYPLVFRNRLKGNESIKRAFKDFDGQRGTSYFTEIDPVIDYVDTIADSTIHVNALFALMDFINQTTDPCAEIMELKAIRFEYNTLDICDYSDDYFKRKKVRIPMCLVTKNLFSGDSRAAIISKYCLLQDIFHKSKFIKLEVFGRPCRQYSFYKIDPIYVSIDRNDTLSL